MNLSFNYTYEWCGRLLVFFCFLARGLLYSVWGVCRSYGVAKLIFNVALSVHISLNNGVD